MLDLILVPAILLLIASPVLAVVSFVWVIRLSHRLDRLERERWDGTIRHPYAIRPEQAPPAAAPPAASRQAPSLRPPVEPAPAAGGLRFDATIPLAAGAPGPGSTARPAAPPPAPPAPPQASASLELRIGTRWFNVAGVVTLLFGVGFFLKYAYENAWIGPRGRVAIGVLAGLASVLLGEAARRRGHRIFSQGLIGGGLAAFYLSFFFAFRLYHLIEAAPAFLLMAGITAAGIALALVIDSLAVAVLSFTGAYLTPVLLSTGRDAAGFLFTYLTVLALGVLGATSVRRWRALHGLAFGCTVALYAAWHARHYRPERMGTALAGLIVLFILFAAAPYAHALRLRVRAGRQDHILAALNSAFALGFAYRTLHPDHDRALGFACLGAAAGYLAFARAAGRRHPGDPATPVTLLGLSLMLLTLAVPLQLGLHGITLGWAAEGLMVVWLGLRHDHRMARWSGAAVLALAAARLAARHVPMHTQPFTWVMNPTFWTWAAVAAAMVAAARLLRRSAGRLGREERILPPALSFAAAMILFAGGAIETSSWFRLWSLPEAGRAGAVAALWTLFAVGLHETGERLADKGLAAASRLLLVLLVLPFGTALAAANEAFDPLFANFVFWCAAAAACSYALVALRARRRAASTWGWSPALLRWMPAASGVLLLLLITVEVYSHFWMQPDATEGRTDNGLRALLAVSVAWGLCAAGLMVWGFLRDLRTQRYAAAALFALTLAKVFLLDVWGLREAYRIASFVLLGLLLVVASFAYSRLRARLGAAAVTLLAGAGAADGVWAEFHAPDWTWSREVHVTPPGTSGSRQDLAWFILDADLLAGSRADLADLRIVDRDGGETAWALIAMKGIETTAVSVPALLNQTRLEDGSLRVELSFEETFLRDRLLLQTGGSDFRRAVKVEARGEGTGWGVLVERAWIHSVPATAAAPAARFEELPLPLNDAARLRVTIEPMPGEREALILLAVSALRRMAVPPETRPMRVASFSASAGGKAGESWVVIELEHRHARPAWIELSIADDTFRRPFRLLGRSEAQRLVEEERTESGRPIQRTGEAPWETLASGELRRLESGEPRHPRVPLEGRPTRHLRLVMVDGDDRPLTVTAVRAEELVHRAVFRARPGGAYVVYYGNPRAERPRYDLASVLPSLHERPPLAASLAAPGPNPHAGRRPVEPFTERHPWILWAVLLATLAVLLLVALRTARSVSERT
ncbi:MAG TPA: DUF2339 domain-containing protein [Candidatus Polarisedimenticolia bacterium]|nr:DUF2339 domain-containing protein [Candidatus Polarisedimenticolia bacterium]